MRFYPTIGIERKIFLDQPDTKTSRSFNTRGFITWMKPRPQGKVGFTWGTTAAAHVNMDKQHIPAIIFDLIRTSKWPSNHPVSQTLRIFQHTHPKYHELVLFSTNTLYGVNHLTNYIHLSLINYLYISPSTDPLSGQI